MIIIFTDIGARERTKYTEVTDGSLLWIKEAIKMTPP
jgi:hypothetical protein